jgi:hypothetical protein
MSQTQTPPPTNEEVKACNDDRAKDGDLPVTAEQIQQVREQTPKDEE